MNDKTWFKLIKQTMIETFKSNKADRDLIAAAKSVTYEQFRSNKVREKVEQFEKKEKGGKKT